MRKLVLLAIGIFVLDRVVKIWILANFALGEARSFIPGLVQLRYTRNTGIAFSFLEAHQWVPMILVPLVLIGLGIALAKRAFPCFWQQLGLVAVMAGGLGNWIDRVLYGYVVDMFDLLFMNFAVFNVADIFITLGSVVFLVAFIAGEWRKGKRSAPEQEEETPDSAQEETVDSVQDEFPNAAQEKTSDFMKEEFPMNKEVIAAADEGGVRVDAFLSERIGMSRSAVQRGITAGEICFSDGRLIKKNYVVAPGDRFTYTITEPQETEAVPQDIPLDVVYEDADLIVVNKPRGMVVHPAVGHPDGTLVNALLHHCRDSLSGIGGELRPGIVHRLDKDTSGLLIAAKNDRAHQSLSDQLRDRSMSRVYEAIAIGRMGQDAGTIDQPIGRHPHDRKRMSTGAKVAREATTHYEVIARYNGYTHVRCTLETGRTHQIRVHLASLGHPILGDLVYGRKKPDKGISGQCLHARSLAFMHPTTGERMELTSELPEYFVEVLSKLGSGEFV